MIQSEGLFHLHFYVSNPQLTETTLIEYLGMTVVARYGLKGRELIRFSPEDGWSPFDIPGVRFRHVQLKRGAFDLVLGRGNSSIPHMEHFGLQVNEITYERCLKFFHETRLSVQEGQRRSFFTTPYGVRMELVTPRHEGRSDYTLSDYSSLTLQEVHFAVQSPDDCEKFFCAALGEDSLKSLKFKSSVDASKFSPVELKFSSASVGPNADIPSWVLPGIHIEMQQLRVDL